MKLYVKSNQSNGGVTAIMADGSQRRLNGFQELVEIARERPIACISAITKQNSNNQKLRRQMTEKLRLEIAKQNDYIAINGGWTNPEDGTDSTEESFIVIGNKRDGERNANSLQSFKDRMTRLCGKFKQWAVLIIWEAGEHMSEELTEYYKRFMNPKYIDPDTDPSKTFWADSLEEARDAESEVYQELVNRDDLELYELQAEYLDSAGNTVREFNHVSADLIGQYFSQIAREAGAQKFTLLSSIRLHGNYIAATSLDHRQYCGYPASRAALYNHCRNTTKYIRATTERWERRLGYIE